MIGVWLVGSFVLGSIPFGYLIAKAKGIDIRETGSGNIGATNVKRTLGWQAGLAVLVLDTLKGAIPSGLAHYLGYGQDFALLFGLAAIMGHMFSPFLGFKGGKGVATGLGALIGTVPIIAGIVFAAFAVLLAITRYVSLSSIITCFILTALIWLLPPAPPIGVQIGVSAMCAFIIYKHRSNIERLRNGTESQFK